MLVKLVRRCQLLQMSFSPDLSLYLQHPFPIIFLCSSTTWHVLEVTHWESRVQLVLRSKLIEASMRLEKHFVVFSCTTDGHLKLDLLSGLTSSPYESETLFDLITCLHAVMELVLRSVVDLHTR